MEKKKCEICGQYKPFGDFSKSYKNRCKACVAEAARNERKQIKDLEYKRAEALINGNPIIPAMEDPLTYVLNPRYVIATHAMQGLLSNPAILKETPTIQEIEDIACAALACADRLMEKLGNKKCHD